MQDTKKVAGELLVELEKKGVTFETVDGKLKYKDSKGNFTENSKEKVKKYKEEIIEILKKKQTIDEFITDNDYETKEAFNDDLIEMIIGGVYNFSKAAAIDYVEEIKSYKAGIPMACVRNGKILPAQKRSPLNLPTRISKLSILPYVTEEIQEIIQGKYMLNIDSYTAAPVSLFSIVNKAHCQKKDLVNALMGQKNSNQKAFIWVRQNKGNDSRCIYFEGKNPSVLTGEILAITANAIFEMPRKDGIYTMASYLEKYQVLDELKKIDKFKSEGKI